MLCAGAPGFCPPWFEGVSVKPYKYRFGGRSEPENAFAAEWFTDGAFLLGFQIGTRICVLSAILSSGQETTCAVFQKITLQMAHIDANTVGE